MVRMFPLEDRTLLLQSSGHHYLPGSLRVEPGRYQRLAVYHVLEYAPETLQLAAVAEWHSLLPTGGELLIAVNYQQLPADRVQALMLDVGFANVQEQVPPLYADCRYPNQPVTSQRGTKL